MLVRPGQSPVLNRFWKMWQGKKMTVHSFSPSRPFELPAILSHQIGTDLLKNSVNACHTFQTLNLKNNYNHLSTPLHFTIIHYFVLTYRTKS